MEVWAGEHQPRGCRELRRLTYDNPPHSEHDVPSHSYPSSQRCVGIGVGIDVGSGLGCNVGWDVGTDVG